MLRSVSSLCGQAGCIDFAASSTHASTLERPAPHLCRTHDDRSVNFVGTWSLRMFRASLSIWQCLWSSQLLLRSRQGMGGERNHSRAQACGKLSPKRLRRCCQHSPVGASFGAGVTFRVPVGAAAACENVEKATGHTELR